MRISTKTSIALHLLVLLEVFGEHKLTSEVLAMSVGCNPVIVRNVMGSLKKAGITDVQRGSGGAVLSAAPGDITLWDVYRAVDPMSLDKLMGVHPNPSMQCPVGRNIGALLARPYVVIADAVQEAMASYTLAQIMEDYRELEQPWQPMVRINDEERNESQ